MAPKIGFAVLSYRNPDQTIRLMHTLNRVFDNPPIVIHHDYTKTDLSVSRLTDNASIVLPQSKSGWGVFGSVEAAIRGLEALHDAADPPDWYMLISESDYPIKPAETILEELESTPFDVHIRGERIDGPGQRTPWQANCYRRYCSVKLSIPSLTKHFQPTRRQLTLTHPKIQERFTPFANGFKCIAGETWFTANKKAIGYFLDFHRNQPAFETFFRNRDRFTAAPEECYYHSIFGNAAELQVSDNNFRYIDWSGGGSSPKTFSSEDLPALQKSSAHFARKFDLETGSTLLDEIDETMLRPGALR